MEVIGSTQIQGQATHAGNLCNASPAVDSVPAMVAAKAIARLFGPDGFRDCPVSDIPIAPGRTSLRKGEFITSILLPVRPDRAADRSAFRSRFKPRLTRDRCSEEEPANFSCKSSTRNMRWLDT